MWCRLNNRGFLHGDEGVLEKANMQSVEGICVRNRWLRHLCSRLAFASVYTAISAAPIPQPSGELKACIMTCGRQRTCGVGMGVGYTDPLRSRHYQYGPHEGSRHEVKTIVWRIIKLTFAGTYHAQVHRVHGRGGFLLA